MTRTLLRLLAVLALAAPLLATAAPATAPAAPASAGTDARTAVVFNRPIVTFRASFLGASPADRAEAMQLRIRHLLAKGGPGKVDTEPLPQGVAVRIDGSLASWSRRATSTGWPAKHLTRRSRRPRPR